MITLPRLTSSTVTEHEPDEERVHVLGLTVTTPVSGSEKVIVPAGDNPPDRYAVQVELEPRYAEVQ
jgi:hypothetical protein